jgi:hypothetical protein
MFDRVAAKPAIMIGCLLGVFAMSTASSAGTAEPPDAEELREYQARFLDRDATDGRPALEGHDAGHGSERQMGIAELNTHAASSEIMAARAGGRWRYAKSFPAAFNAIHVVTGPHGKVLLVAGSGNDSANLARGSFRTFLWDTTTNTRKQIPTPEDLFCAGHLLLPDGRALIVGGTTSYLPFKGETALYAFNFTTERYERLAPMAVGRWYPSTVTTPRGDSLIVGGLDENGFLTDRSELFRHRTNRHWLLASRRRFPLYPHLFLTSKGTYFYAGAAFGFPDMHEPGFWDPFNGNTFKTVEGLVVPGRRGSAASCLIGDARHQVLMVLGGGAPATATTSTIDLDARVPRYDAGPRLRAPKAYLNCVNLPDGTVLEAHGGTSNRVADASRGVGLLRSADSTWQAMNPLPAGEHRLYHSLLFLLDDGRVASLSSNPDNGDAWSTSLLIYSPPYLYQGTRPRITRAPTQVKYRTPFVIRTTAAPGSIVTRIALVTPASQTHSLDLNQRYASFAVRNGTSTIRASRSVLPPGWYRMFAIDAEGRPSVAHWVQLS